MIPLLCHIAPNAEETCMAAKKEGKMYPLHDIFSSLKLNVLTNLPGFHALTGCDSTSGFLNYGKKPCWDIYLQNAEMFDNIGHQ